MTSAPGAEDPRPQRCPELVPLDATQTTYLARARRLLSQEDWEDVAQGLNLLSALDDPQLWAVVAEGLRVEGERVQHVEIGPGEIRTRVKPDNQNNAALWVAREVGLLDDVVRLDLSREHGLTGTNRPGDLQPLAGLERLDDLTLECDATDLSALAETPSLRTIRLSSPSGRARHPRRATETDLRPLARLPALERLEIQLETTDLKALSAATSLVRLNVRSRRLNDIRTLADLPNLRRLDLSSFVLADLDPLQHLRALTELTLNLRALKDIRSLRDLHHLEMLSMANCAALTDLSPLEKLPRLHALRLTRVAPNLSLSGLAGHPALERLYISRWRGSDLTPLASMSTLEQLRLVRTDFSSVAPLAGLPTLRRLTLRACTRLTDLTGLGRLPALTDLLISDCPALTDLSGLQGMSSLKSLRLTGTPVPSAQIIALRDALPDTTIYA